MRSNASSPEEYIAKIPAHRQEAFKKLRAIIKKNLPKGFEEVMTYGMIGYVVPHSRYPAGYHVNPALPLGLMNIASQKNFIAVYHMGIYGDPALLKWFTAAHAKASPQKLDMGKSCIRYKKPEDIPFNLIGELASKLTPDEWIALYEKHLPGGKAGNKKEINFVQE
jgi:Domain of unknown function (DU1801)